MLMVRFLGVVAAVLALLVELAPGTAVAQGIYTCVDAKGRKITADRPIAECNDRSQLEVSPTGVVRRVIPAAMTAQERAALEEKEKQEAEVRLNQLDEKRRDRALLTRYPNRTVHDKERALALEQVNEVIRVGTKRVQELAEQRKAIGVDMEFYKKDPSKAPPALKRRVDENDNNMAIQIRFISDQDVEIRRVNQRFDDELTKLKPLWAAQGAPAAGANAKSAPGSIAKKP